MADDSSPTSQENGIDQENSASLEEWGQLRQLLVRPELRELEQLRERLDDPVTRAQETSHVLAMAASLASSENRNKMSAALLPAVEDAIQTSVKKNPRVLVDAVYPIIGPSIRKALAALIGSMIQALNEALEHSLTWRGLRYRWEAFRTGKPFGEVVLLHTLIYRVEEVFLIHRQTGLLLHHASIPSVVNRDADLVSGMLTAIQDFCRHAFRVGQEEVLETMQIGGFIVWIEPGPEALLAAVIRGNPPLDLQVHMQQALESIHRDLCDELKSFQGETFAFEAARPVLESCLQVRLATAQKKSSYISWIVAGIIAILVGIWAAPHLRDRWHWSGFLERLGQEPGIVVTAEGRHQGKFFVAGLRDPLARDPALLMAESKLSPDLVENRWETYFSTIPQFVLIRCRNVLKPPASVTLRVENGILYLEGSASHRWISETQRLSALIPGITKLQRDALLDLELNKAESVRQRIENQTVLFAEGSALLDANGQSRLRSLAADLREMMEVARAAERSTKFEVIGHTDSTGAQESNLRLGQDRAERIMHALVAAGIESSLLSAQGVGASIPAVPEVSSEQRALNRRVSIKVHMISDSDIDRP